MNWDLRRFQPRSGGICQPRTQVLGRAGRIEPSPRREGTYPSTHLHGSGPQKQKGAKKTLLLPYIKDPPQQSAQTCSSRNDASAESTVGCTSSTESRFVNSSRVLTSGFGPAHFRLTFFPCAQLCRRASSPIPA